MSDENEQGEVFDPTEIKVWRPDEDPITLGEQRIGRIQKFIALALRVTTENDWVDFDGRPYLQASGCEKVARLFGVSWKDLKTDTSKEIDAHGEYRIVTAKARFYLASRPDEGIEIEGKCSTRDKFFGTVGGELKPIEDVDLPNIQRKAVTNMVNRGIKKILGLSGLTWEMVKGANVPQGDVAGVRHKTGRSGGTAKVQASVDNVERVKKLLRALNPDDVKAQAATYHAAADFTSKKDGKLVVAKPPDQISEKQMAIVLRNLEQMCQDQGVNPDAPPREPGEDDGMFGGEDQ